MKEIRAPKLEARREREFLDELKQRAAAWMPAWGLEDSNRDFGKALLGIAARFSAEVSERLDRSGDKMRRGLLDWLGIRGQAAIPARVPVVYQLTEGIQEIVLAKAPIRLQADVMGSLVVLETETDVDIVPARIAKIVAAEGDQIFLPPPGLSSLEPLEPKPTQWRLKSSVDRGSSTIQLEPELGLEPGMLISMEGVHYRIAKVDGNLVTIEPPLESRTLEQIEVKAVDRFAPYSGARNWQQHVLYVGDEALFNSDALATIEIQGAGSLDANLQWQYWGKGDAQVEGGEEVRWRPLARTTEPTERSILLIKPVGSMEILEVAGRSSRWIRAITTTSLSPRQIQSLKILINSKMPPASDSKGEAATGNREGVELEGMANTTPLVLEKEFLPLGREPKQQDAFYLGSQEGFSKKKAKVTLDFTLADTSVSSLSVVKRGAHAFKVLAGISREGGLRLFQFDGEKTLSVFGEKSAYRPRNETNTDLFIDLEENKNWKLPIWSGSDLGFSVAAISGTAIWEFKITPGQAEGSWIDHGVLPDNNDSVDCLIYVETDQPEEVLLVALAKGKLYKKIVTSNAANVWQPWTSPPTGSVPDLKAIAPITRVQSGNAVGHEKSLIGITASGDLYLIHPDGNSEKVADQVSPLVQPMALTRDGKFEAFTVSTQEKEYRIDQWKFDGTSVTSEQIWEGTQGPKGMDLHIQPDRTDLVATVQQNQFQLLVMCRVDVDPSSKKFFMTSPTPDRAFGTPAFISKVDVVVSGERANLYLLHADKFESIAEKKVDFRRGILAANPTEFLESTDSFYRVQNGGFVKQRIGEIVSLGSHTLYHLRRGPKDTFSLVVFPKSLEVDAEVVDASNVKIASPVSPGSLLWIEDEIYKAVSIAANTVTLDKPLPSPTPAVGTILKCRFSVDITGTHKIYFKTLNAGWAESWIQEVAFLVAGRRVRIEQVIPQLGATPAIYVAMIQDEPALPRHIPDTDLSAEVFQHEWFRFFGDNNSNPELSWEYWNGKGWWGLETKDGTRNLRSTGAVEFSIPEDMSSSDWSGKTNYWIRARLVGGDYGSETVTLKQTTNPEDKDVILQTVERSRKGFTPPVVRHITVSYQLLAPQFPSYVLTEDSHSLRDQSDANRTEGATIDAFVPFPTTIDRLTRESPAKTSTCSCDDSEKQPCPEDLAKSNTDSTTAVSSKALYLGVDGLLAGSTVQLFFLVDERDHTEAAPVILEALVANRFVQLVSTDHTRGLGESGVLSMAFTLPPTPAELFGASLRWLRIMPRNGSSSVRWLPSIRGAYINAVWASAMESLTRELLGSSDGAPNLSVALARPPVLRNSLELRIKEPLSQEERTALLDQDPYAVMSQMENLPGDWVLWKQVTDPLDEDPQARVYSLDEAHGQVRFGDGLNGMIPPIGKDSIVAFRYQRTEPSPLGEMAVPANRLTARTVLGLVSPVAGVESVIAADQAAGGAPAESDRETLERGYIGLRHRQRGVTSRDIEDLTLQSSPDIAQVRAINAQGRVKLIIVMRGLHPHPSAPQMRAIQRNIMKALPPALAREGALQIAGPRIRLLRVYVEWVVDSLELAAVLSRAVKQRLEALLDTSTGGFDQQGWQLGASPTTDDIAFALSEIASFDGLRNVRLVELLEGQYEVPWPAILGERDIAQLSADPLRLDIKTREVIA